MLILALDLGLTMGWASAHIHHRAPRSGAVRLKKSSEPIDVAEGNLIAWLCIEIGTRRPDVIVKEGALSLPAMTRKDTAHQTVSATYGFHSIVRGVARRFGVRSPIDANISTVRKHFLGHGGLDREQAKRATVQRCQQLNFMTSEQFDDNQADALAILDWAVHTIGRSP